MIPCSTHAGTRKYGLTAVLFSVSRHNTFNDALWLWLPAVECYGGQGRDYLIMFDIYVINNGGDGVRINT